MVIGIQRRRGLTDLHQMETYCDLALKTGGRVSREGCVKDGAIELPIYSYAFGSEDQQAPVMVIVGGVHGLESIGTRVVLSYMHTVMELLRWDRVFSQTLKHCKLVFYPIVNPYGIAHFQRSNINGVDLMRNAPVEADDVGRFNLVGGHRYGAFLPWYRGEKGEQMQYEAQLLCDFIERETWGHPFVLSVDVHSGFGMRDRLWFPYAKNKAIFENIVEVFALKQLLKATLPHHIYRIEPQSLSYTTHGDLWDYLYLKRRATDHQGIFLPFCLEMGSWLWIKKNPLQLFSRGGIFNPVVFHRMKRVLRRHLLLFDFLLRASVSHKEWLLLSEHTQQEYYQVSLSKWYGESIKNSKI